VSIRLRLALSYGGLFALVLLTLGLLAYGLHTRSLYGDLDRALVTSAGHTATELASSQGDPDLIEGHGGYEVILALYNPDGTLRKTSAEAGTFPGINPRVAVATPAGPAYDTLTGLIPVNTGEAAHPLGGAFALVTTREQRWRVYIVPVSQSGALKGYVAALTPLGAADASVRTFGISALTLGMAGFMIALVGSWIVASRALRPVTTMSKTARAIARSRDFSQRIEAPLYQDELGGLAMTLNEMLGSLEGAYRFQQRFVSDASHELRAPLTAIQANLELLQRHPEMTEADQSEALTEASRESTRLTRLVADLLALARADVGIPLRRARVDLDAIVLDAFGSARQLAQGQTLTLNPFEPVQICGDADRLKQLTLILLDNALKYTPPYGEVSVGLRRDGDEANLMVRDTGVGISADDLPHVFERFYRADRARSRDPGGTGLGLSIADWIVQQHGGRIDIDSDVGEGTTVTVRLAVVTAQLACETLPATSLSAPAVEPLSRWTSSQVGAYSFSSLTAPAPTSASANHQIPLRLASGYYAMVS
jgi:signal transduction histidine kinase